MSTKIMLKNVRLSFPSLFKKAVFDGKEGKFEATVLIGVCCQLPLFMMEV